MNVDINNMDLPRAYSFRIPNDRCQPEIKMQLRLSKDFYNKFPEKSKEACEKDKTFEWEKSHQNFLGSPRASTVEGCYYGIIYK